MKPFYTLLVVVLIVIPCEYVNCSEAKALEESPSNNKRNYSGDFTLKKPSDFLALAGYTSISGKLIMVHPDPAVLT